MRAKGFTLLELMLAIGIALALSAIATVSYLDYLKRAHSAQLLVNVDNIKTVVAVENLESAELQTDAVPGVAPPRLNKLLADSVFQGYDGITLWLIKAPAGTFKSYPDKATYSLVARAPGIGSTESLAIFRMALAYSAGDVPWLDSQSFSFPLMAVATSSTSGAGGGATGGGPGGGTTPPDTTPPPNPPACSPGKGSAKGKNWCWCTNPDGSKVKEPC